MSISRVPTRIPRRPSIRPRHVEYVQSLLYEHAGYILDEEKSYLIESRLVPLMERRGLSSLADFIDVVGSSDGAPLRAEVVEAMLNTETTFFRDISCFNALRDQVLPRLVKKRASERKLRIWCAACSTGQEPYSIAMVLREHFPELASWDVRIIASDVSSSSLAKAKSRRYRQIEVNRGLPVRMLVKYFAQDEHEWLIDKSLQENIEFHQFSLLNPWPIVIQPDIVFLRNVMIYWNKEHKREILRRMRNVMRRDGYLFLGAAETTYFIDDAFDRLSEEPSSCFIIRENVG